MEMDTYSSFESPKTGPLSVGSGPVTASGLMGSENGDELTGVSLPEVEGETVEAGTTEVDAVFTTGELGTPPLASMASRAAFSLAFLALSNTSSYNNQF